MVDIKTHHLLQHVNPVWPVNIATPLIQSKVQLQCKIAPRASTALYRLATMADTLAILVTMELVQTWSLQTSAHLALKSFIVQRKV